jgi:hypothetical protein
MSASKALRPRTLIAAAALASASVVGLPMAGGTAMAGTGASISLQAPSSITYTSAAQLTGRLTRSGGGLAGRTVLVQGRPRGSSAWRTVASVRTSATGAFHVAAHPARNMEYRTYSGHSVSAVRRVGVRALVTASLDSSSVEQKGLFHLHLTVSPVPAGRTVVWQQADGSAWSSGGTVTLDAGGSVDIGLASTGTGTISLRGFEPSSGRLLAGASDPVSVTITAAAATTPTTPTPPAPPSLPGGPPPVPGGLPAA